MQGFCDWWLCILVVMDVVVRGIDVDNIIYVFYFNILDDFNFYIYCFGCIGWVGNKGISLVFVYLKDCYLLWKLEKVFKIFFEVVEIFFGNVIFEQWFMCFFDKISEVILNLDLLDYFLGIVVKFEGLFWEELLFWVVFVIMFKKMQDYVKSKLIG